ncbi:hypothetical protein AK812_SmicGene18623 [Symbiodinium microadriaticum]|uniref:Pentatricopeptide repeat-containing protein n=1 Tax=Symbiodinium microadriaticum TaxID=2951 RepID=A0A1Q9DUN1_SYMMI|nr:hypothetical protein AK812_SmicGene18623 [Symbiodinium microadriaticum]
MRQKPRRHWLQLMSDHGREPDGSSYLAILEGFAKVHRSDLAQNWWDLMIERGVEPQGVASFCSGRLVSLCPRSGPG